MDIFGFETQGINYDKFRPRYPHSFYSNLTHLAHKNRYLDIATGTGQLLFALAPYFENSYGIDISPSMIKTSQKALQQMKKNYPLIKIKLQVLDVMKLNQNQKYDLITVGQALHFFPIEQSLIKIRDLIQKEGTFATFGYILKSVVSQNINQNDIFDQFYKKVKPLFTFDRDDLHSHYSNQTKYPFSKIFQKVNRQTQQVKIEMTKLEYTSYLKTMSGYNLYLKQNKEDPLVLVEQNSAENVTCIFDYFKITCQK